VQIQLEAAAPRVRCPVHGVTVATVQWARHQSGHTLFFDDQVAWLATQASKTVITVLMRVAWRTVGAIITRVWGDTEKQRQREPCRQAPSRERSILSVYATRA